MHPESVRGTWLGVPMRVEAQSGEPWAPHRYMLCVTSKSGVVPMPAERKDENSVDPFEAFRGMRDSYLDAMSKLMINAVNSEEYAQATGAMLNTSLMASAPFREALEKATAAAMQQASM